MKILVFSDSHHDINNMIYTIEKKSPHIVIHLGDNLSDAIILKELFPDVQTEYVPGNCDMQQESIEKIIEIKGITFFITHGHIYNVKSTLTKLIEEAKNNKADIVLFGHTHKPYNQIIDGIRFINPGSISPKYKLCDNPSFALINLNDDGASFRIEEIKSGSK